MRWAGFRQRREGGTMSSWLKTSIVTSVLSLGGASCILENNPAFGEQADGSAGGTLEGGTGLPDGTGGDETVGGTGGEAGGDVSESSLHVGPDADACEREVNGQTVTSCDFWGEYALRTAAAGLEHRGGGHITVYGGTVDAPAYYRGGVLVGANTEIEAAPDTNYEEIVVYGGSSGFEFQGLFVLVGDGVVLRGMTLVGRRGSQSAIQFGEANGPLSGGHTIENLQIVAIEPEKTGSNGIGSMFGAIGPNTTIRNNYIWGYWEPSVEMSRARGTHIHHNTMVLYQGIDPEEIFDVKGAREVDISNNVFVALTRDLNPILEGDENTADCTFVGNVVENFESIVVEALEDSNQVEAIPTPPEGLPLESPRSPRFYPDTTIASHLVDGEGGTSLDGVPIAEAIYPGAFQQPSASVGPRPTILRVGTDCGATPCDVRGEGNTLQEAVWTAWPGTTIEVYQGTYHYFTVSWPVDIVSAGTGEVIVDGRIEGTLHDWGLDASLEEAIRMIRDMDEPVVLRGLTIRIGSFRDGIYVESGGFDPSIVPRPVHLLENLTIENGTSDDSPLSTAVILGADSFLRNSLIDAPAYMCVHIGIDEEHGGAEIEAWVANVTCRLHAVEGLPPQAAIGVSSASGQTTFLNMVIELFDSRAAVFRNEWNEGSNMPSVAGFQMLDSLVVRNMSTDCEPWVSGFTEDDLVHRFDHDCVSGPVLDEEAHLPLGQLDFGTHPSLVPTMPREDAGISLDGVNRDQAGLLIDQGCFEGGL